VERRELGQQKNTPEIRVMLAIGSIAQQRLSVDLHKHESFHEFKLRAIAMAPIPEDIR
jgi:hypothetical protein